MTPDKVLALLALTPVLLILLYNVATRWRFKKYAEFPQLPKTLILGHLKLIAEIFKRGDGRRHADYIFRDMLEELGNPELFFADIRPISYGMCVVASHNVAEQITRATKQFPYSVPKSPTFKSFGPLIGKTSIIGARDEAWKSLRKRFNPGFAPQHLVTLLPQILDKTSIFMAKLDTLAESGIEFEMEAFCTNLTFDIIGAIVMDIDFGAQGSGTKCHPVVKDFRDVIRTYTDTGRVWLWLNLSVRIRRMLTSRRADRSIKQVIREKFSDLKEAQKNSTKANKNRSVLALSLKDTDKLTPDILQLTADQLKSFLFAGHDTTSIMLLQLFYALSIHPKALAAIRAEHDAVFGDADPREVFLARPDETMKALTYTSACIKEVLRLWPPAASARMSPPGTGLNIRLEDGRDICVDGTVLYLNHYLIQRDRRAYGDTADDFVPERWLGNTNTSADHGNENPNQNSGSDIPTGAWRPFERGPRNCIGQELANLEARVILACVVRRYDFTKVGAGEVEVDEKGSPLVDEKGRYKLKSELFNCQEITSKPFDKGRMKVRLHKA
jgi:cytochrome P450